VHPDRYRKRLDEGGSQTGETIAAQMVAPQREYADLVRGRDPPDRLLRWPQVQPLVGVSRTTWWRLTRSGDAPAPVRISPNCVGWMEGAIRDFLASRAPTSEAARSSMTQRNSNPAGGDGGTSDLDQFAGRDRKQDSRNLSHPQRPTRGRGAAQ
jgi:predicted DNA-binding transcriptional regulator AlpA